MLGNPFFLIGIIFGAISVVTACLAGRHHLPGLPNMWLVPFYWRKKSTFTPRGLHYRKISVATLWIAFLFLAVPVALR